MIDTSYEDLITIGGRLKIIREVFYKLSQKEFADILEVSLRSYQNYEKNKTPIPHTVLSKLKFQEQNISIDWLIHGNGSIHGGDCAIATYFNGVTEDFNNSFNQKNFSKIIDRLFCYHIHYDFFLELGYDIFTEKQYLDKIEEYDNLEKLKIVSNMLNLDLVHNKYYVPYEAILDFVGTCCDNRFMEWFIFGTVNNIKYSFYDIFVKKIYLYENELIKDITNNLEFAPKKFLEKLNSHLIDYKNKNEDFFYNK